MSQKIRVNAGRTLFYCWSWDQLEEPAQAAALLRGGLPAHVRAGGRAFEKSCQLPVASCQ